MNHRKVIRKLKSWLGEGPLHLSRTVVGHLSSQLEKPLGRSKYQQINFDFSPLYLRDVIVFLKKNSPLKSDLIVVPPVYLKRISKCFPRHRVVTPSRLNKSDNVTGISRVFWCTSRVDSGCNLVRKCYENDIDVLPMRHVGPAKPWMHCPEHENVLKEEFINQTKQGFAKFSHGIGADFVNILQCIDYARNLEGVFLEIGCYRGSSTCVISNYMHKLSINKKLYVYDYFDGFTYPEALQSNDKVWANTHKTEGINVVRKRVLSRGLNPDLLSIYQRNIIDKDSLEEVESICFANLDVDMYEAVLQGLLRIHEKLVLGGVILVEDKGHTPQLVGACVALAEFFEIVGSTKYFSLQLDSGQQLLLRVAK